MSTKKELSPQRTANNNNDTNLSNNNNIKHDEKHEKIKKSADEWEMPDLKTILNPATLKKKARCFVFVVYPESAPSDWIERLCEFGIPFAVSPLHDKDVNPDGATKKEHYHVLLVYENTTTLKAVAELFMPVLHSPVPQICASAKGMYRYFTHADNPEKYQYESSEIKIYCGFEIPIDAKAVREIQQAIECYAIENGILEYAEMSILCGRISAEWYDVFTNHTMHFGKFFSSLRHNYEKIAKVYNGNVEDKDND